MSQNKVVLPQIFYFKVDFKCCNTCQNKAKKGLQKLEGVTDVDFDKKTRLVAISGQLDPQVVVKKFAEWGKKAQICSPNTAIKSNENSSFRGAKDGCRNDEDSSSYSESDAGDAEYCDHKKPLSKISWQHPDIADKSTPAAATRRTKRRGWLLGLCRGKHGEPQKVAETRPGVIGPAFRSNVVEPAGAVGSWLHPRGPIGMHYHGGPIRPPFPPHYGSQIHRPMAYGSVAMPPPLPYGSYSNYYPPPPPAAAAGYYPAKNIPQFNPMIHYTRYEDNYSYW